MINSKVIREIDAIVLEKDLLKHPFYQAWSEGALPIEALQGYAMQYYKFVNAFPRYLSAVHSNCEDLSTRQLILENLAEEENREKPHPELWLQFGKALSLSRSEISDAVAFDETNKALDILWDICRNKSYLEGSASLYAYESRVPEIADTKIKGLEEYYKISGAKELEYFTLHRDVDVLHAEIWRDVISRGDSDSNQSDKLINAVDDAMTAFNLILDGVQREYAIA